jgi:hypothetical protein
LVSGFDFIKHQTFTPVFQNMHFFEFTAVNLLA